MTHLPRVSGTLQPMGFRLGRSLFLASLIALSCLIATPTLAVTYSDNGDGTVTDPITGLTWMRCSMGQTWDGTTCTGTANTYIWDQANALTVSFAGQSDWRLPNIRELLTIVDWSSYSPAINATAFPNTPSWLFWSASAYSDVSGYAWYVDFGSGFSGGYKKSDSFYVRLVRAGQSSALLNLARPTSDYVDHGNGTVTHTPTGLMWKRCAEGQNWDGSTCTGTASTYTWDAAKLLTSAFAGENDWRTPTEEELLTLSDYAAITHPAINRTVFPNTSSSSNFWSASAYANNSGRAWGGGFWWGGADGVDKSVASQVRLVRAGQSFNTFTLTVAKTGTGTGTVSGSALTGINCGGTCTSNYDSGTKVVLTATPGAGSGFGGWGGACSGRAATCTVTMSTAQSVTAEFGNFPGVSVLPTSLSFGSQYLGTTSAPQTVTLTNSGGAALNITGIVATGDYAVTHNCGTGLGINGFCTLSITFTPTTGGTRSGAVTITDDAFDGPQTVSLSGIFHGAAATLNATSITFPAQSIGTTSAPQTITLTNMGDETLNLTSITASGDYAVTNNCGAGLGAGGSCSLSITFTPTVAGARSGTVSIASNAAGSPDIVSLNGVTVESVTTSTTSTTTTVPTTTTTTIQPTTTTTAATTTTTTSTSTTTSTPSTTTGTAATTTSTSSATTTTLTSFTLTQGWNLVGNGVEGSLDVAATFGDATKVTTVWKWVISGSAPGVTYPAWAFYAPSLTEGGQVYAASKGYEFLTTIKAGEGFWVNANAVLTATLPAGTAIKSSSFLPLTGAHALPVGWNLIATGDSPTAEIFNSSLTSVTATPPSPGSIAVNLTTLWAWEAMHQKWYFWAPSLVNSGGLSSHISSKGYLDFATMPTAPTGTLSPTTGFWVNMPAQ